MSKLTHRFIAASRALRTGKQGASKRRTVPAISLEEVAEARSFFPLDKFFIYGHARSGTTLLTRLVRLHPQVHCNYQGHFFTRPPLLEALVADEEVGQWLSRRSNRWNQGSDLSPLVLRAASDFIMERDARRAGKGKAGCIVGDKSPNSLLNSQAVNLLSKVYPDARLIFIVRDGRDAAVSHRIQSFIDSPQHLNDEDLRIRRDFTRNPEPFLNGERSIFTHRAIHHAAQGWVDNVEGTHEAGQAMFGEHYLSLRFEDLLRSPWEQIVRLWRFLGADATLPGLRDSLEREMSENPDADWQQSKAGDLVQSVKKGGGGSWQELFTEYDRQTFRDIAGPTLLAWSYESNLDW